MDDHVFEEGDKEDRVQAQSIDDQEDLSAAIAMGGLSNENTQ